MSENYIVRQDERGSINISEEVIAVMVGAAIREIDGVAGLSNTIGSELADFISRKSTAKGVKVQEAVAGAVESMTGLDSIVNVHISGISYEK